MFILYLQMKRNRRKYVFKHKNWKINCFFSMSEKENSENELKQKKQEISPLFFLK